MFEKAQRKVEEAAFFVRHLRGEQGPDAVEFYFNALINAGKNVVNALHAHIRFQEGQKQKPPTTYELQSQALRFSNPALASLTAQRERRATVQVKKRAQKVYRLHFKGWRRSLTPDDADLFEVLQELRNIEVHARDTGSSHVPKIEERRQTRTLPADPRYVPVFATYIAMGVLSADITVGETTYYFQVDTGAPSEAGTRVLFERFGRSKGKPTLEVGETYVTLLKSLVEYFVTHYA